MYLMIQNDGVAPVEGYTLLGMSTTRNCGASGVIGQFGSGTKHAINLLLRKGIEFYIYCGKTRLEFFYVMDKINDGLSITETAMIKCKISGGGVNKTINCGWCLDFGVIDWTDTSMAIREFVSNAIDRTIREEGDFISSKALKVEPTADRRAKSGKTRIFISMHDPDVQDFYRNLSEHFLHFSGNPQQVNHRFLDKNPSHSGPIIYREGVLVRKLGSSNPALFDYNFKASEIEIDECRNSSEYSLRGTIAMAINKADSKVLTKLFSAMLEGKVYESGLDEYYLNYSTGSKEMSQWQEAWVNVAGNAVAANKSHSTNPIHEYAKRKGHKIVGIDSEVFLNVAKSMGVRTVYDVLSQNESEGKVEVDSTWDQHEAVDSVWGWCLEAGMTNGKTPPRVKSFRQLMDAEGETLGYYKLGEDCVHLREDLGGKLLLKTAFEEVAHYITGATDNSRDFQQFFIDMIVEQKTGVMA